MRCIWGWAVKVQMNISNKAELSVNDSLDVTYFCHKKRLFRAYIYVYSEATFLSTPLS